MSSTPRPLVIALGVFPPPVTGMSLCTQCVAAHLAGECEVVRINLSDDSAKVTWSFRINKLLRMCWALVRMIFQRRFRGATLYMPLNAGGAMYYNLAAACVARLRGWRTVVHHHVYLYLRNRDWRVRVLDRLMGRQGLHLLLCPDMRRRLIQLYDAQAQCAYVPSTILLTNAGEHASVPIESVAESRPVRRLGHISNLSQAKGALLAIRTFAKLRDEGHDVELVMAGPTIEDVVDREIERAKETYHGNFDYRGPVYGEAKSKFFQDIDVLLFPSTFRLEAQPIVLSEAFAYGKPALTIAISCIPSLVGEPSWHVCPQKDFVEFACDQINEWRSHPDRYAAAQQFAHRRAVQLEHDAREALARFSAWVARAETCDFIVQGDDAVRSAVAAC